MNYPAFDWVNKYNTTYASKLGAARPAWYMPSIAELSELYKNRDAVNASFLKIKGLDGAYADGGFETGHSNFWSSSQYLYYNDHAEEVVFNADGSIFSSRKDSGFRVCCIAAF